jgi:diguanylate cyclase (GGDEF)-like protein
VLVAKQLPPAAAGVPAWFVNLFPLHAPSASSLVTQGWRQLGRVSVTSHTRFAYRQLWRAGIAMSGWLAAIYLLALAGMRCFLAGILRPLKKIEEAAAAIARREYPVVAIAPRARELRSVVDAINLLSVSVRQTLEAETARADRMQRAAYLDSLTGLWNRRGLERQYEARLREDREAYGGALLLLEIADFAAFNRAQGYQRGDDALKLVAEAVEAVAALHHAIAARTAGAGFVLALVNVAAPEAQGIAAGLCNRLHALLAEQQLDSQLGFHCGTASFPATKPELGVALALADAALGDARLLGDGRAALRMIDAAHAEPGSMRWRELIEAALANDRFVLWEQPVESLPGRELLHRELTTRLVAPDGEVFAAGRFLPMAVRHGLTSALDRKMLEMVFAHLEAGGLGEGHVAVNLSAQAAADAAFMRWMQGELAARRPAAARLIFEMAESAVLRDVQAAAALAQALRQAGARFALDHFGCHRESVRLLQRLLPAYVKLAPGYAAEAGLDHSAKFFVASIVGACRSLGIDVLAQAVEDAALLPLLTDLGVAGFQGHAAARPRPAQFNHA